MRRRDVLKLFTAAALAGVVPPASARAAEADDLYDIGRFGNARVLHMTDTHAQLAAGPFPRAERQSRHRRRWPGSRRISSAKRSSSISASRRTAAAAHAFTYLDFAEAAHRYGQLGGFAHLKTLIDRLRAEAGPGGSLLLDGGDLWQGSGLADAMHGEDMVEAANLLGIDVHDRPLGIHLWRGARCATT